jgi:hypothetical protein
MPAGTSAIIGDPERITALEHGDLFGQSQFLADQVVDHGAGGIL